MGYVINKHTHIWIPSQSHGHRQRIKQSEASACVPAVQSATTHDFGFLSNLSRYRVMKSPIHREETLLVYKKPNLWVFVFIRLLAPICTPAYHLHLD